MSAYLTVNEFKLRSIMPDSAISKLETVSPGFLDAKLSEKSAWIDSRLAKRYAVPFAAPVSEVVLGWLVALVTVDAYLNHGFNPESFQDMEIVNAATAAKDEIKEAANSQDGFFELPLKETSHAPNGVVRGGPLGYSEPDPYSGFDVQRRETRRYGF